MKISDSILTKSEKITFSLRELYSSRGYTQYKMGKFEEYDFYAKNKNFLVSDDVITFTDTDGKLMALKPDVTLSIIKNGKDLPDITQKVFYNENVYRVIRGAGSFGEIMQAGVECFGKVDEDAVAEVLSLAGESLKLISDRFVLAVSDLDVIKEVIDVFAPSAARKALLSAIGEKNAASVTEAAGGEKEAEPILKLLSIKGEQKAAIKALKAFSAEYPAVKSVNSFCAFLEALDKKSSITGLYVDFSVLNDVNYYNGVVFKGYVDGVPSAVLSGGRYDNLMAKLKKRSSAIGFAVYTDELNETPIEKNGEKPDGYINVALPKGRLGEKAYEIFASCGYDCPTILEPNRKLVFENEKNKMRFFWVKPSDIAIYVERGAADIGVVGKDILNEYETDVYELCDLKIGKCKMAVAAPKGFKDDPSKVLRVATKFLKTAKKFYREKGRNIDVIKLNGSIEIAPLLKLSDVIVDIVETGSTLRENNLEIIEVINDISARLIANKSAYKFKNARIDEICDRLFKKERG